MIDKAALLRAILDELQAELSLQTDAAIASRDEATNEESRAEDKYDMRSQSAAYLAAGQAKFATEIAEAIAAFQSIHLHPFTASDAIALGALVALEGKSGRGLYFIGPYRGGLEVEVDGKTVTVVTPGSPLGRQMLGQHLGGEVLLPGRLGPIPHHIAAVS